jgi:hypothetical protein
MVSALYLTSTTGLRIRNKVFGAEKLNLGKYKHKF